MLTADTVLDHACSATLSVPYYQSVADAGLDGAGPPPPGVAKDKLVPDHRLYPEPTQIPCSTAKIP